MFRNKRLKEPVDTATNDTRPHKIRKHRIFGKLITSVPIFLLLFIMLPATAFAASWWEVYFTAGDGTIGSASALETYISDFMLKASSMCYVANYSWSDTLNNKVVLNINSLDVSGVDVRVVGDDAQGSVTNEAIHPDITATIPMNDRTTAGSANYMHDKIIIRDPNDSVNAAVMMGSGNFNEGGWESQNNTFLFLYDQDLALNYLAEFNEMFNGTFAGGTQTTRIYSMPDGVEVRSFFGSEDQPWAAVATTSNGLISILDTAAESIFFEITDLYGYSGIQNPLEASCINRAAAGAIVEGVYQSIDTASTYDLSDWNDAAIANANGTGPFIRESAVTAFSKHHHKYWVIDLDWAGVGSVNASQSSSENNPGSDENFILIKDFRLAREFAKEFGRNYAVGTPVGSVDNTAVTETHDWQGPGPATNLSVTAGASSFDVSWTASTGTAVDVSRYYIFISTIYTSTATMTTAKEQTTDAQGGHLSSVLRPEMQNKGISSTTLSVSSYKEGGALSTGINYYIGVVAVDKFCNESTLLFGGPYTLGADTTPPADPTGLAVSDPATDGNLNISWTANVESDLNKYWLYRSVTSGVLSSKVVIATVTAPT
ncbi:MAG: phospholipase D-like domain-containing protein, partial [Candidatus Omnitrophota bacterium]